MKYSLKYEWSKYDKYASQHFNILPQLEWSDGPFDNEYDKFKSVSPKQQFLFQGQEVSKQSTDFRLLILMLLIGFKGYYCSDRNNHQTAMQ